MIRPLFIMILLISSFAKAQKSDDLVDKSKDIPKTLYPDKVKPEHNNFDKIFIYRKVTKRYYHAIYIDTTRQSEYYKWSLTDFVFDENFKEYYEDSYSYIKNKNPNSYKSKNFTDLPEQWAQVYLYKSKYYLYKPSDGINERGMLINDSAFVFLSSDVTPPALIQSIKRQGSSKYVLEIIDENLSTEKITIYIIDKKTKLSVFEFSNQPKKYRYELYIPVKSANYFDRVVNESNMKQPEFEFDKIDYQKLIKGLK